MSETRSTVWPLAALAVLSLAAGFAWGRFRPRAFEIADPSLRHTSEAVAVEDAPVAVSDDNNAHETRTVAEASPAGSTPTDDVVDSASPRASLGVAVELIDSLRNATGEELARLRWDGRVRAALDELRASAERVYPVDSGLPPAVLAELVAALLERAGLSLDATQRARSGELAAEWEDEIDRRLSDLGDDSLALERELCVVGATDSYLEAVAGLLDEEQLSRLDSATPPGMDWPPLLSPLTGAPLARRELAFDDLPALRESLSRELARELGLDPQHADGCAARLVGEIEPLLRSPSQRGETVERIVELGLAQARLYRELLEHPALDEAARRRLQARRGWLVPVIAR